MDSRFRGKTGGVRRKGREDGLPPSREKEGEREKGQPQGIALRRLRRHEGGVDLTLIGCHYIIRAYSTVGNGQAI